MREVAVGHVPQCALEPARVGHRLESLVDSALDEAPLAGEQPGDPVLAPAAPDELAPEVEVLPPDLIDLVRRSAQDRGQLVPQRVGHALVRVQREYPFVARLADGRVALRGDGRTGPLEHRRPRLARRGNRVVGRSGVRHDHFVRPGEVADALGDLRALVEGRDDDGERDRSAGHHTTV